MAARLTRARGAAASCIGGLFLGYQETCISGTKPFPFTS